MTDYDANGTAYEVTGPQEAPALVLIHGLGLTRQTWEDFIPVLSQNYRVISYDLWGHGETALPPKQTSLTMLSDQLVALLDHLQIRAAHLVGFSLGGMINRRVAMDYPDKILSLVILNSPHERTPEAQTQVEQRAKDTSDGGASATIEATLQRWFTDAYRTSKTDKVNWVRQTVLANHPENYVAHRFVLANGVIELIRPTPAISAPCLVITCENDTGSTPAMSHAITGEITGAETLIIPHLQHLGLLEDPQAFLGPITAFLDTIDA